MVDQITMLPKQLALQTMSYNVMAEIPYELKEQQEIPKQLNYYTEKT